MATTRQKEAAKRNIAKAREEQSARARGERVPEQSEGISTAQKDRLKDSQFAFPKQRKEPLTDARHVRNAIARFDQVEGVSDAERDEAWKRIKAAARRVSRHRVRGQLARSGQGRQRPQAVASTPGRNDHQQEPQRPAVRSFLPSER